MRASQKNCNEQVAGYSGHACMVIAYFLLLTVALNSPLAFAQNTNQAVPGNRDAQAIAAVRDAVVLSEPFQVGEALNALDSPLSITSEVFVSTVTLNCRMICSADQPRQTITEVSWEEPGAGPGDPLLPMRPMLNTMRLDIVGASARFEDGGFGTARLSNVPGIASQAGAGIDLNAIRLLQAPALLQPVRNNTIVARPQDLLSPEVLKTLVLPDGRATFSADALAAIERDDIAGGLGRIQLPAQTVETRRGQTYRSIMIEGMQPGQTYRLRLVNDPSIANTPAETITGGICRVRVCPADFKNQ